MSSLGSSLYITNRRVIGLDCVPWVYIYIYIYSVSCIVKFHTRSDTSRNWSVYMTMTQLQSSDIRLHVTSTILIQCGKEL